MLADPLAALMHKNKRIIVTAMPPHSAHTLELKVATHQLFMGISQMLLTGVQ